MNTIGHGAKRPKLFKNYLKMYRAGGWLRQLVCLHGPIGHSVAPLVREPEQPYAYDFCTRCLKVTMKYYSA